MQGVDQHPGAQVLVEGFEDLELLRPLDVVSLVFQIDARLVDVELVEGLDGLQLEEPGADQPGHDDVLRHLGVRAGGNAKGCLEELAVLLEPETIVFRRDEERRPGYTEDRVLLLELGEDPVC